jgi:YVTN family beta-propeller protein
VSVIDTVKNKVIDTIQLSSGPLGVAIRSHGERAYVTGSNTVYVIDISTNTVIASIPTTFTPSAIAITPDGTRAYAPAHANGDVYVISTATNTLIATIKTDPGLLSIAISPDGTRAYVADPGPAARTSVIDTTINKVIATIPVGGPPPFLAVTPDGSKLYVGTTGVLRAIDLSTNLVVAQIPFECTLGIAIHAAPQVPRSIDDCKDRGYQQFGLAFSNQGQCLKYAREHAN